MKIGSSHVNTGKIVIKGNPSEVTKVTDIIANKTTVKSEELSKYSNTYSEKLIFKGETTANQIKQIRLDEGISKSIASRQMSEQAMWGLCCNPNTSPLNRIATKANNQIRQIANDAKAYNPKKILKAIEKGYFDFENLKINGVLVRLSKLF